MVEAEFVAITLQLINFGIGLVLLGIATDLWLYRRNRLVKWIIFAYALAGVTFLIVSLVGQYDYNITEATARLGRQLAFFFLAFGVYTHLKNDGDARRALDDEI